MNRISKWLGRLFNIMLDMDGEQRYVNKLVLYKRETTDTHYLEDGSYPHEIKIDKTGRVHYKINGRWVLQTNVEGLYLERVDY